MLRSLLSLLLLALLLVPLGLAACSGSSDPTELTDQGYAALGKGDYPAAMEAFKDALAKLQPSDPGFVRAKMGEIEAWIRADANKAHDEFLELARSHPEEVGSREYGTVANKMVAAQQFMTAIDVLDAGIKAHAEDPKLKATMDEVKAAAQKAGDPEAIKKLQSLGYL